MINIIRKVFTSFSLALHNIRLHFFRTLLSVLGIVIGVGALVSILSLIDGMERYARAELAQTTSLSTLVVQSNTVRSLNGIQIRKDSFSIIRYADFMALTLRHRADVFLRSSGNQVVTVNDSTIGAQVHASGSGLAPGITVLQGTLFTSGDLENKKAIAVINESFAKKRRSLILIWEITSAKQ
jgi:putative ABC transport system permease protein